MSKSGHVQTAGTVALYWKKDIIVASMISIVEHYHAAAVNLVIINSSMSWSSLATSYWDRQNRAETTFSTLR